MSYSCRYIYEQLRNEQIKSMALILEVKLNN